MENPGFKKITFISVPFRLQSISLIFPGKRKSNCTLPQLHPGVRLCDGVYSLRLFSKEANIMGKGASLLVNCLQPPPLPPLLVNGTN